jgi:hypothetical protein
VEQNVIYNCAVGIRLGVLDRNGFDDHSGGIIRNNFIYREGLRTRAIRPSHGRFP